MYMDILDGSQGPQRGDLMYTALKDRRGMRLRLVLHSRPIRRKDPQAKPRYQIWAERWWEIEPETRLRLFRSTLRRAGGQRVFYLEWYPRKKKSRTIEDCIRRGEL